MHLEILTEYISNDNQAFMSNSRRDWQMPSGIWLLVLAIASFAIYFSSLHIWYYGDDFQYVYEEPVSRIFHFFYNPNLFHGFYRPVNSAIIAVVQVFVGLETWPIHVINILVHALLCWMVFLFMKRERFATWQAVLASAFMVVSQENASAVLGNDTFSQISGTFFGCMALWLLYLGYFRAAAGSAGAYPSVLGDRVPIGYYLLALLSYAISLASKETSVAYGPIIFGLFLAKNWKVDGWGARLTRSVLEVIPFFVLTLLYIWTRAAIGLSQPTDSGGNYGFKIGLNVIENLAQFVFAAVVPASSATAFVAIKNRELVLIGAILLGTVLFLGIVAYGLWRSRRHRTFLVMIAFSLLGLVPAIFMNHVGELYLYNSMPFIAVLVGAGLGGALELFREKKALRAGFWVFLGLVAASHIVGVQGKAAAMATNGARARNYLAQIGRLVGEVPRDGQLLLLNPEEWEPEYSVYLMKPFSVFKWGVHIIRQETNRWDMEVVVVEKDDPELLHPRKRSLVLALEGDSVVIWKHAADSVPLEK